MRFNSIFFDLDGTIADTQLGVVNGVKYAANKLNITTIPYERTELFIGPSMMSFCQDYLKLDKTTSQEFVKYMREYYLEHGIAESSLYSGMRELMIALREQGAKVYICTAKYDVSAKKMADLHDLTNNCDGIMGSSNTLLEKTEILECMMAKYNADPKTSVMVGDRYTDIDGAKANKCASVGVLFGYGARKELEDCGSDFVAETVQDLHNYLV